MQGQKIYSQKFYYNINLDQMVPQDDFYRKVNQALNLNFLYKETKQYYGSEGNQSIDPVVFFKICMVGYLNNICSDRGLIKFCSNCLNIRLFLGYDLDEALPWHSTISRTRQLFGEDVFRKFFKEILRLCVEKGMVSGRRQAVDSAFIKANASMESLLEKEVLEDVDVYADQLAENSEKTTTIEKKKDAERRQKHKEKYTKHNPGANSEKARFLSNKTHYSPTDPDARISTKPGKQRHLNYFGQLSVDTSNHVITAAGADFADKNDHQCLEKLCDQAIENLHEHHIKIDELIADTGYCGGEALKYLERKNINAWIPNMGKFSPEKGGLLYNKELNQYECLRGNRAVLPYRNSYNSINGIPNHRFWSGSHVCKSCVFKEECCGKEKNSKTISHSMYNDIYLENHKKRTENYKYAEKMSKLRKSTVEPVLGTLLNFMSIKRVNTKGIQQAEKHVLMSSSCYNLKKMLNFNRKNVEIIRIALENPVKIAKNISCDFFSISRFIFNPNPALIF